ncbi:MAG: cupin domain-containing protein [Deltaproteobacteria bacterium CG_4_9_14_3_um_filter_63_12]|nr:MAG: cupin domain-containing protein [Deltaproteobacteria bacterium CG17_big_fil_post_rev_8_21_14_2_50_63_7]PJB35296.1 MAG: cupin domain-containing protein [Deltaproteobacteria bacterium CG_4_9_14_3_um_filter_63_12]
MEDVATKGAIAPSKPVVLKDLVDYAQGAIVSRTIAKSKAGTLTLFAFSVGEELSEHSAPFDAYVQVLDGRVELTIAGEVITAESGETVLMPRDVPHAVLARQPFKMLLTMLKG